MNTTQLTPTEVAQDVLDLIKAKKIRPNEGLYFHMPYREITFDTSSDVKSTFDAVTEETPCQVCALGGMLLAITLKKNKLSYYQLSDLAMNKKAQEMLLSVFSPEQIALIESAFENGYNEWGGRVGHNLKDNPVERISEEDEQRTIDFYQQFPINEKDRLVAIMENIIQNNGVFIP